MSVHFLLRIDDLGDGCVLAPERFDPRSHVRSTEHSDARLDALVQICSDSVRPAGTGHTTNEAHGTSGAHALVLDTTHAYEGFVIARHGPQPLADLGSSKRVLQPGDVIVSRLRPYLRQVALIDEGLFHLRAGGNHVVASSEFFVLRKRSAVDRADGATAMRPMAPVDPAGLIPFLLSPSVQQALAAGQEGGHHPRFRRDLLAGLPVPDGVLRQAAVVASRLRAHAQAVRAALQDSQALALAVDRGMADAVVSGPGTAHADAAGAGTIGP